MSTPYPTPGSFYGQGGTSPSDLLTALKNAVTAINNATQTCLEVNGTENFCNISGAATLVSNAAGRLATVSIIIAGSTVGYIYDSSQTTILINPLIPLPNTVGCFLVRAPVAYGIVVVPGTDQVVSVNYS
jgi:hypothetical protein